MKRGLLASVAFVAALGTTGCDQIKALTGLQEQTAEQEIMLARHDAEIASLNQRITSAENLAAKASLFSEQYDSAVFDPTDSTYQRIETSIGPMLVRIDALKPHADGTRLTVFVANLTSATAADGSYTIKWGPRKTDDQGWFNWMQGLKDGSGSFTERLPPGRWTKVAISLPGMPPDKIGYIDLDLDVAAVFIPGS